jgi:hypothetical protein
MGFFERHLHLAAKQSETEVDNVLRVLIEQGQPISFETVEEMMGKDDQVGLPTEIAIDEVDLTVYDELLAAEEGCYARC